MSNHDVARMKVEEGDIVFYEGDYIFGPSIVSHIDEESALLNGVVGDETSGFCFADNDEPADEVFAKDFDKLKIYCKRSKYPKFEY